MSSRGTEYSTIVLQPALLSASMRVVFQPVLTDSESAEQVVEIDELEDVTDMVDLALHASGLTGSEKQLRGLPC